MLRLGLLLDEPLPEWMEPELGERQILDMMVYMDAEHPHLPPWLISPDLVGRLQDRGFNSHGVNSNFTEEIELGIEARVDKFDTDRLRSAMLLRHERSGPTG